MPQPSLTDADLKAIETELNRFEPTRIREVLDDVGEQPAAGDEVANTTASGPLDFGSVPAGVLVYRTDEGAVRLRLTVTEMTGATYEEFELSDARLAALARAAVVRLEQPMP